MNDKNVQHKILSLGLRTVCEMNFSKFVTLPKTFTDNYLDDGRLVAVSLSPDDGVLTLTPVKGASK